MSAYKVIPLEEKPKPAATQWSVGIAMFAAFVIPFVLLVSSGRYRTFVAQAKAKIEHVGRSTTSAVYSGAGTGSKAELLDTSPAAKPAGE
jgi:uncharacterized membrane protein